MRHLPWIALLFVLAEIATAKEPLFHLTWSGYTGTPPENHPIEAAFYFNGNNVGKGLEGLAVIRQMNLPENSRLRIKIPDEMVMTHNTAFIPPYDTNSLLPSLIAKRIKIQYEYKGKACDIRTFWYDGPPSDYPALEATEFFLDWVSLGRGTKGLEKLASIKWGKWPCLQIMMFGGASFPLRTHREGDSKWPVYPGPEVQTRLRKLGVRIEVYIAK